MPHRDSSVALSTDAHPGIDPLETLDAAGLAPIVKRKASTIRVDVSRRPHTLPPFIRVGGRVFWLKTSVATWLKEKEAVVSGKASVAATGE